MGTCSPVPSRQAVQTNTRRRAILSGSLDHTAQLVDVETQNCVQEFSHKTTVSALAVHPKDANLFLAGEMRASISAWDMRTGTRVREYKQAFHDVQDLCFI